MPSSNSKPLAGSHVLIVSQRRELRTQIQAAIQHMGLIVDLVGSMAEAAQFCEDGLPHGIVFETGLRGADFERLHADILDEVPDFCFVEVLDEAHLTQLSTATADSSRDALRIEATTGPDGSYSLPRRVPPGNYELRAAVLGTTEPEAQIFQQLLQLQRSSTTVSIAPGQTLVQRDLDLPTER